MLSRIVQEFAAQIRTHDWSDAHERLDRAGHQRKNDPRSASLEPLTPEQTDRVGTNVMWVTAQVLLHADPQLDLQEYAAACGVPRWITHNSDGKPSGTIKAGIHFDDADRATWPAVDYPGGDAGRIS